MDIRPLSLIHIFHAQALVLCAHDQADHLGINREKLGHANKAAVVNAGLEIIATLSHHYGVRLPIVVDNAESVTELLPVDSQVIRLVVSAEDESLRVEVDK